MTLQEIIEKTKQPNLTPQELSEMRLWLSGEYAYTSSKLEKILVDKPARWLTMRSQEGINSDKQADRMWDCTRDGMDEIAFRMQLKSMEKLMSTIKTRLEVSLGEARTQW